MECLSIRIEDQGEGLKSAMMRYDMLLRASKTMRRCGVQMLAFGLNERQIRFVLDGNMSEVVNVIRGIKVGTLRAARARGIELVWGTTHRIPLSNDLELLEGVEWAHRAAINTPGTSPLNSVWSSHRDIMGFREAPFYDATEIRKRIPIADLHENLQGRPCPSPLEQPSGRGRESLGQLLRIAGAVLGVLPADRKCFRLFAHLARLRGWRNMDIAFALSLTGRRVRQLLSQPEPKLWLATVSLADARLAHVP